MVNLVLGVDTAHVQDPAVVELKEELANATGLLRHMVAKNALVQHHKQKPATLVDAQVSCVVGNLVL